MKNPYRNVVPIDVAYPCRLRPEIRIRQKAARSGIQAYSFSLCIYRFTLYVLCPSSSAFAAEPHPLTKKFQTKFQIIELAHRTPTALYPRTFVFV